MRASFLNLAACLCFWIAQTWQCLDFSGTYSQDWHGGPVSVTTTGCTGFASNTAWSGTYDQIGSMQLKLRIQNTIGTVTGNQGSYQIAWSNGNQWRQSSTAACYISSCGCPPLFLQTWCTANNTMVGHCLQNQNNCESNCNGKWCQAITTQTNTITIQTNNTEIVLQGSIAIKVTKASWLANQTNFSRAMKQAIGNMSMVDADAVYIMGITLLNLRRLIDSEFDEISQPVARALRPGALTTTTASGLKIDFEVRVTPNGKNHVTANILSDNFNGVTTAEATGLINQLLASNMFGDPVSVQVTRKFIKSESSSATPVATPPSTSDSKKTIFVAILSASLAAFCCFALPIKLYIAWKRKCKNKTVGQASAEGPNGSYEQLLNPPSVITREYGHAVRELVSSMLDHNAKDAAHVAISFSPGMRAQDAELCGPGLCHAAAIIKALLQHDIRCCVSECWLGDQGACHSQLSSSCVSYKMLVVLESCALYKCRICLEEIHAAFLYGVQILRLQTDQRLPSLGERWPEHREAHPEVEHMILRLDATPSWSKELISDLPHAVDKFAQDVRSRLQLGEFQGESHQASDTMPQREKNDSLSLLRPSKDQPQVPTFTSLASSSVRSCSSSDKLLKQGSVGPPPPDKLRQASKDVAPGGQHGDSETTNSASTFDHVVRPPNAAHKKKHAKKNTPKSPDAAAVGGDRVPFKKNTHQTQTRGKHGATAESLASNASFSSGDHMPLKESTSQAKNGPAAAVLGKNGDGSVQMVSSPRKALQPTGKEEAEGHKRYETKSTNETISSNPKPDKADNAKLHHRSLSPRPEQSQGTNPHHGSSSRTQYHQRSLSPKPEKAHSTHRQGVLSPRVENVRHGGASSEVKKPHHANSPHAKKANSLRSSPSPRRQQADSSRRHTAQAHVPGSPSQSRPGSPSMMRIPEHGSSLSRKDAHSTKKANSLRPKHAHASSPGPMKASSGKLSAR